MKKSYLKYFDDAINNLKSEGRYREFTNISRNRKTFPIAYDNNLKKNIIIWCSNDYLAMGGEDILVDAMKETVEEMGAGAGGTRNISGSNHPLYLLEQEMADLHGKEKALVFNSGYIANEAAISTICNILPNPIILSDEYNHASMIAGIKHSRKDKVIFRHNDMADLEEKLKQIDDSRSKIILFESVYSMNGNIANIEKICDLADKYNAITYIDEVHAIGLYGNQGGGLTDLLNISERVDIIQATFAKAYGCVGGYVASSNNIIDSIRSFASSFIFTTAMPPAIAASNLASVRHLRNNSKKREMLHQKVKELKQYLSDANINFIDNNSHIIAVLIGDPIKAKEISNKLKTDFGIYIQHINYPTVPKGTERLRITVTPAHTEEMAKDLVNALSVLLK